jgi:antitoxin (DNA-binding transcriptional repressor) of toxin-antitoxin stability system
MTATDAARSFSEVLNRVADGEQIEVTRSGAPIAVIGAPAVRLISAERFRELLKTAPAPDDEFADDLRALRRSATAPSSSWPS